MSGYRKSRIQIANSLRLRKHEHGVTLVELMVAMVLGLILVYGASKVYVNSRQSYTVNESLARLQESARYAISVLEPDIRMSNYWGLMKGAAGITGQFPQTAAADASGENSNYCGRNFALDLINNIEGSNNAFVLGVNRDTTNCAPVGTPLATADTLTIRRAAVSPTVSGKLLICSSRVSGQILTSAAACTPAPVGEASDLIVHSYYVTTDSSAGSTIPALRRKVLSKDGTGKASFADEEVIQGVEDFQIQFGIEDAGSNTGVASHYINPAVAGGVNGQIVSVRVWLLIRAETPEADFIDDKTYSYGDRVGAAVGDITVAANAGKSYQPSLSAGAGITDVSHYRRLLVSRTFNVRNALGT